MPCTRCNKNVSNDGIIYCTCKCCNKCHPGGICPDGSFWFKKARFIKVKGGYVFSWHQPKRDEYSLNQSHGGHEYYPK